MNTSLLHQISFSVNYMDNMARKFMNTANVDPGIANLYLNPDDDNVMLSNGFRFLNLLVYTNDYVYSAYTVNLPKDRIISTEDGAFYSAANFYDPEVVQMIKRWDARHPLSMPVVRRIPKADSSTEFADVYTYIMPYQTTYGQHPTTALVVNVKASYLRELIASLKNKTGDNVSDVFVIDANGTVVNHALNGEFLKNARNEEYVRTVLASDQTSGSFKTTIADQPFNVTYVSSGSLKWKFISLTSYQSFLSPVDAVKSSTLIISTIVLLLGLLFSLLMSKSLYSPFRRLVDAVRLRSDELDRKQRDHRPKLKENWLKEIILGQKDVELGEFQSKKEELGIRTDLMRPLRIVLFRIDGYRSFLDRYHERDRRLLKFGIANIIDDISSAQYTGDVVDMDKDKLVLILESAGSEEAETDLVKLAQNIQHSVNEYLRFSLSVTIGKPVESRNSLGEVYSDTLALSMYRLITGHGSILTPSFLSSMRLNPPPFPEGKAKLLLDSLKLGRLDKTKKYYDEIVEGLLCTTYETVLSSMLHLMFMIRGSFPDVGDIGQSRLPNMFHSFLVNIYNYETIGEIHQTFEAIFTEIVSTSVTNKQNKRQIIVTRIKKMIEEQYRDSNLNLNLLAEAFQMSPIYLGRLFKESTGKSAVEYITEVRMARVKQLLDESSLSTKEILEQCGWEESNYFYVLFKKHFGIPLSQYRISRKKADDSGAQMEFE
ncbi:helix-turn-helix domain-containing protein [Cohnella sp. REN36]|uniref:helix-turn-helix domain-containing protein n=1 Tax=Cohnella sp. REN36 TaxID=2887347 RepID=UPI001D144298|nr:helix-turn-helix domain-containing protein [Cohnella sp. REN36]MCC3375934.1 AraC family transcriptional regulator [Cohnella sp. REN36]